MALNITQLTQAEKLTLARRMQQHIAEFSALGIPQTNQEALEAVLVTIEAERSSAQPVAKATPATAKAVAKPATNGKPNVPPSLTFTSEEGYVLQVELKQFQGKDGKEGNWGYSGKFPTIANVEFNYVNPVVRKAK